MTTTSLDDILISDEFVADPYDVLGRLRVEHPVYWCEPIGAWLVTRFDDVMVTSSTTNGAAWSSGDAEWGAG